MTTLEVYQAFSRIGRKDALAEARIAVLQTQLDINHSPDDSIKAQAYKTGLNDALQQVWVLLTNMTDESQEKEDEKNSSMSE